MMLAVRRLQRRGGALLLELTADLDLLFELFKRSSSDSFAWLRRGLLPRIRSKRDLPQHLARAPSQVNVTVWSSRFQVRTTLLSAGSARRHRRPVATGSSRDPSADLLTVGARAG